MSAAPSAPNPSTTDARHPADRPDLIRVVGARDNNLREVSVDIPKRRLTVFTGASGSGKSSFVFDTITAESQRMINVTYSAFVQGFMPSRARPDVDLMEGVTTAIIVDQERMGAHARSTVGLATDANAMLRILFSKLGEPFIGAPNAFLSNIPTSRTSGMRTTATGERIVVDDEVYLGGMCPRCEGTGSVSDIDLAQLYDDSLSLADGALTIPGYTVDGWICCAFSGEDLEIVEPGESENFGQNWLSPAALTKFGEREPAEPWTWAGPEREVEGHTWGGCIEVVDQ